MCGDFEAARRIAEQRLATRESIGRLNEKRLHATLKFWLDADETHHEIPLPCGAVADIFDGQRVTEIQNGNFSKFRVKLMRLLYVFVDDDFGGLAAVKRDLTDKE